VRRSAPPRGVLQCLLPVSRHPPCHQLARLGPVLTGVLPYEEPASQPLLPQAPEVTLAELLQEVAGLNYIAVILAVLLCIFVVFFSLILAYLYFKGQDKRQFKTNKKTILALNSKLLNGNAVEGKSYGSNNAAYDPEDEDEVFHKTNAEVTKEGKSKFYKVESQDLPDEGKSKFYRQEGLDLKTPSVEGEAGFQQIFNGTNTGGDDDITKSHTP
jgi:hypothetical protein